MKGLTGKLAGICFVYAHFKVFIVARLVASVALLLFQTNQAVFLLCAFVILTSLVALSFEAIYGFRRGTPDVRGHFRSALLGRPCGRGVVRVELLAFGL